MYLRTKYTKEKLTEIQGEIDNSIIIETSVPHFQ